jgi:hypothetical protein
VRIGRALCGWMPAPAFVQLPLPSFNTLAYPRAADGLVHQCAWCGRVLDRGGRFRIWAQLLHGEVSHGVCSQCASLLRWSGPEEGEP